jgi:hypothetical protein
MTTRTTTDTVDNVFAPVDVAPVHIISARGSTEPQSGSRLLRPIAQAVAARSPVPVAYTELAYPATSSASRPATLRGSTSATAPASASPPS